MTPTGRRRAAAVLIIAVGLAAGGWWFDARTRPDRVGPRFLDALVAHHPGATVTGLDGGMVRAAFVSGTRVDVRLSPVFDACARDRFGCSATIDRAVADVDAADALGREPRREALRPVVLGEPGGYRYGYVAEPLVGALELRYALVAGLASTYVTSTMADRLALSREALRVVALANQRTEGDKALERIDDDGSTRTFRVRSAGDPAASLIDDRRMRRFADAVGMRRMYVVVPTRGTLAIGPATAATATALDTLRARLRGSTATTLDSGLLLYDVDAPADSRLTVARADP